MSDLDEKLIIKLGQRITEQTAIFRMIAASLHGIEANLRQMAISSNTTPNYQRLLSEYPSFDWPMGCLLMIRSTSPAPSV